MFNFLSRGLSKEEVAKTLKKIRKQYNDYIVNYMKSTRTKDDFERRYYFAAKYKENMATFFKNEIIILNGLIKIEQEKQAQIEQDRQLVERRRERQKNGDFADRILKDLEDRIKLYPEIDITKDASHEIRKLYGALRVFEDRYWNALSRYIKTATPMGRLIDHLENDLWQLIGTEKRVPPVLDKYIFLLERPDHDLRAISYAEQECMKQVAFFLNELMELYRHSNINVPPPSNVVDGYNYMNQLIFNFRLADLKKN